MRTPRDSSCLSLLEEMGLRPSTPPIRSSHYGMALRDPWSYYVIHRLGLVPKLSWSKCLTLGSWFHTACEFHQNPKAHEPHATPWAAYRELLNARLQELAAICASIGHSPQAVEKIGLREEREAYSAWALYHGSSKVPLPSSSLTWTETLHHRKYVVLGTEIDLTMTHPVINHPVGVRLDALLYHREHNTLWIVDYKTTSKSIMDRAAICPIEFQTQLYLDVVDTLLTTCHPSMEKLLAPLNLTEDQYNTLSVRGMMHVIIRKPGIQFGMEDRDFEDKEFTPTRGPNKGVTRMERVYVGQPKLSNYVRRVSDWYTRSGTYLHLAETESAETFPVGISHSPKSLVLADDQLHSYHSRLKFLHSMATRIPAPENFLVNPGAADGHDHISHITDLSVVDIANWPTVISSHNLMVRKPDETIIENQGTGSNP